MNIVNEWTQNYWIKIKLLNKYRIIEKYKVIEWI